MTDLVAQCPRCSTRFHLGHSQLEAARGIVRCGNCRALFNAAQPVLPGDSAPPASVEPAVAPPSISELAQIPREDASSPWTYRGVDLDSLDLDVELAKLDQPDRDQKSEPLNAEHGEREARPSPLTADAAPATDFKLSPVTDENPAPPSPLSADTRPIRNELARQRSDARIEPAIGQVDLAADESRHADNSRAVPQQPAEPNTAHFDVEDEPLQLDWQPRRTPWGRWLAWSLLILIALAGLVGQYVYYNLDELARQERYRPWLEQICPLAGCTLPSRVDIEQIRSSNLVVRSHPDFKGALVVDAIIYNRAPFPQPFPLLEFSFADINGNPIASRSFKPGEYLSGELTGQQQMPSQVPIHISLDILDPGTRAVNYSLGFRSPE